MLKKTLCAALAVIAVSQSFGQAISSITPDPGSTFNNGNGYTLGWTFTVGANNLFVTALGYFDNRADGLAEKHQVGIFDSSANLQLASTVTTVDPLTGLFRYNSNMAGSNLLLANTTYVIGGSSGTVDEYTFNPTAITFDPNITFNNANFVSDGGFSLNFPGSTDPSVGFFGPNFKFEAVPEPASMVAMGAGLIAMIVKRRRK